MGACCTTTNDGCGCDGNRSFFTRDERIQQLTAYQDGLKKELQGVTERIAELEKKR